MMRAIHRLRHVGGLFVALVFALSLPLVAHAVTNTWSAAGSLTTARYVHTATLLPSGQVLVAGGYNNSSGFVASAERYDPATNTWSAAGSLAIARDFHTATLLPSGQVLVAGGYNGAALVSAERYDRATNTWSAAASLTTGRYVHTATLLPSGQVLVAGGYNDSSGFVASAELYDPATNTWSAAGSLTTGRYVHTATLLPSGQVLVAGGYNDSSGFVASAERYDPATNTWSAAGSLTTARYFHTATRLPSGQVLVAGGWGSSGYLASAERYDPATNTWSAAGNLITARYVHTATLLPSGQVLVAGGGGSSGYLASAELYDPATNTWSAAGSLTTGRYVHTATRLPSGQVLVAGGDGISGVLASAELYTPEVIFGLNLDQHGLTGSWDNPAINGQGIVMEVEPDFYGAGSGLLFAGWYTNDVTAVGGQRWYTLQAQVSSNSASVTSSIYLTQGGSFASSLATTTTPVGQATLQFSDCTHGSLHYNFSDGSARSGTIPLTRLDANVTCGQAGDNGSAAASYLLSGAWYNPATSGQGLVFDVNPIQNVLFAGWYTYASNAGQGSGPAGQRWYTLQATLVPGTSSVNSIGIYDTTGGVFNQAAPIATHQVGNATLVYHSCSSATLAYTFTAGANAGLSGTLNLSRLGAVPNGCHL